MNRVLEIFINFCSELLTRKLLKILKNYSRLRTIYKSNSGELCNGL